MSSTSITTTSSSTTSAPVSILCKSTPPLSLSIPQTTLSLSTSSSADSSKPSSPIGIIESESGTNSTASCSSLPTPQTLSVKFAPLPELAPRKRKSDRPLGIAARTQLMRKRREMYGYQYDYDANNAPAPVYVWSEDDQHQMELVQSPASSAPLGSPSIERPEDDLGDPFGAFGRLMKGAGKSLWRRVSHKDLTSTNKQAAEEQGTRRRVSSTSAAPPPVVVVGMVDSRLRDENNGRMARLSESANEGVGEEGGVWEEEIGQKFVALSVTQTGAEEEKKDSSDSGEDKMEVEDAGKVPGPPSSPTNASVKA